MNTDLALKAAGDLLAKWVIETKTPEPARLDVILDASSLLAAVRALDTAHWGYLAGITGLDLGAAVGQIQVLYHFCAGAAVLTLRVGTPRDHAVVPSICDALPAASFYERELREMMGVEVVGLLNMDHLFLPDDWPDGVYPLRKDAEL
ncbi:MAG: NADH-quinone oxidoreductase subunit C [Anaerolineae bacterium]|nr:NADH-quinone oxidoreductase subunit C [Anaerolineae bacterium]